MRTRQAALSLTTILAATACAAADTAGPESRDAPSVTGDGAAARAGAADTTTPVAASSRVRGRVRLATWRAPGQGTASADTTQHTPVAGATLKLYRNLLVDGRGVSRFVMQTTSAADGSYTFGQLEGGYYLVYTSVPGVAGEHLDYLAATRADVTLDVTVW